MQMVGFWEDCKWSCTALPIEPTASIKLNGKLHIFYLNSAELSPSGTVVTHNLPEVLYDVQILPVYVYPVNLVELIKFTASICLQTACLYIAPIACS